MSTKDKINNLLLKIGLVTAMSTPLKTGHSEITSKSLLQQNKNKTELNTKPEKEILVSELDSTDIHKKIKELKAQKEKLKQDSLEKAINENIEEVGIDIRYNAKENQYDYEEQNGGGIIFPENFDFNKIEEEYKATHQKKISQPIVYEDKDVSIYERIVDPTYSLAFYNPDEHAITINRFTLDKRKEAVEFMMNNVGCTEEEADSLVLALHKELNSPEFIESRKEHEESHADDFTNNYFIPNLPRERIAQIQFFSEMKATMRQAGLALKKYNEDGDTSHFAPVNRYISNHIKKVLANTPDKEKRKKIVGISVLVEWQTQWNKEGSPYNWEVLDQMRSGTGQTFFLQEYITETKEGYRNYLERVNDMFSDVKYLGDMREIIDPDFKLNKELKDLLISSNALQKITQNSETNAEAYQRLADLFKIVRDSDSDGMRTKEEQEIINKAIKVLTLKAQTGSKTAPWPMLTKVMTDSQVK